VIVNSAYLAQRSGSPLTSIRRKVRLIPNGVDTKRLFPQMELRTTGTIGFLALLDEFHRYKGLDVLLRAVQQLVRRGCDVHLSIGGDGALREEYERMAHALGVARQVRFHGRLTDDERLEFFNQCQVFVLPSTDARREGFGLVALEAMACGVPAVVTSAAGVAQFMRNTEGAIVVPPSNVNELAAAIERILNNPAGAANQGQHARRLVEAQFSWPMIARQYEQLYAALIPAHPFSRG
jgi:glycosyltransferase involved in cell wall biosynthesis